MQDIQQHSTWNAIRHQDWEERLILCPILLAAGEWTSQLDTVNQWARRRRQCQSLYRDNVDWSGWCC